MDASALGRIIDRQAIVDLVTVDGDQATCQSAMLIHRLDPSRATDNTFDTLAHYTHTLVRTLQGWKITRVQQSVAWNRGNPATPVPPPTDHSAVGPERGAPAPPRHPTSGFGGHVGAPEGSRDRGAPRLCRGGPSVGGLGGHVGAPIQTYLDISAALQAAGEPRTEIKQDQLPAVLRV